MANSHHVSHLARLGAACCVGLLGVAAAAQSPRETQKIVVDAVPVDVNYRANTALLKDVVITQGDMRIEAAEANVVGGLDFENGEWSFYCAPNDVETVEKALGAKSWEIVKAEVSYKAKNPMELSAEQEKALAKFLELVEDNDDVKRIHLSV